MADILIRGMDMPKNCDDCFLGDFYCEICQHIDGYTMDGGRPFGCPIIEVPPHGRLGDLDALVVDLMDRGVEGIQTDELHEILQAVMDAPTIIPASEEGET